MRVILLMMLGLSVLNAEFIKSEGIVRDTRTGLEWQDNNISSPMTWKESIDYCQALSLNGEDWRVPNINELISIVDDTKYNPSIDSVFENTILYPYWSSTTTPDDTSNVWVVVFYAGNQNLELNEDNCYIRCVRTKQ